MTALRPMGAGDWLMLVVLSMLWSGSFFFVAVAVTGLPTFTIVGTRVMLSALALGVIAWLSGYRVPLDRRTLAGFAFMGIFNNAVPLTMIAWAQRYVPSGLASILSGTMPLFIVVVAHFMTHDERLNPGKIAGVLLGLVGLVVLIGVAALDDFGINVIAELVLVASSVSYAFGLTYGRRMRHVRPTVLATGQLTVSSLVLMPVAVVLERPWLLPQPDWTVMAAMAGLICLSTVLAYMIYYRILATAGATSASLVTFLIPIGALALGIAVLGERLETNHVIGMALILAGLLLIDGRVWRIVSSARAGARSA
jgi:drug/metabolite transporter (DMT)-like permease